MTVPQKSVEQQMEIENNQTPSNVNTPQRAVIRKTVYTASMTVPQKSVEQLMEIENNQTPSIANTTQRAVIPKTVYAQPMNLPQKSVKQQMEIENNQTPSIADNIKEAVDQEKRLYIEYAPPLLLGNSDPQRLMLQPQKETQMELSYSNPITHTSTPLTIPTSTLALPSLPAPVAPPFVPSLPAPPAPLSLTHIQTSRGDSSKNDECDECAKPVEYKEKLPITHEINDTNALVPYNDYISMTATPEKKNVFYTCTRCNTNFKKQKSLMNHNKRFHAAFEQTKKGHKRKSQQEVLPYGVQLLKQQKARGVKRRYEQNTGSNKEIAPYKPYVVEKTT